MEPDRYQNNNKLYILGIICLVLALAFFFFSMYLLPYLIWNFSYSIPGIIISLIATLEDYYEYTRGQSRLITWLLFFVPSLITGYISYYVANRIDNQLLNVHTIDKEEKKMVSESRVQDIKESTNLGLKILFLMIAIVVAILLLHYLIQL